MRFTNRFQKWALATTLATYVLILIGGFVRASDAGLGCPDWPTCFGRPYPPFTYAELLTRPIPADFDVTNFNVRLAWIEYVNRLSGTVIGLLVIGALAFAIKDHRRTPRILYPTILAFVTVVLNGWLGSQVVESRLSPLVISAHLLLALVQVSLLLYATVSAFYPEGGLPKGELPRGRVLLARGALFVLFLALTQAGLGADLRGQLENIEEAYPQLARGEWIHLADWVDDVHRSFSWTILAGVFWMVYYTHTRLDYSLWLRFGTQITGLLVILQVAAGVGLAYSGLPPVLQVAHLVIGSLLIGAISAVYLLATRLPIVTTPPVLAEEAAPNLARTQAAMD